MINEALRLLRVIYDYRTGEMASKLGVSSSYISRIENGRKEPPLRLINQYAALLGVASSTIISFSERLTHDEAGTKQLLRKSIINSLQNLGKPGIE